MKRLIRYMRKYLRFYVIAILVMLISIALDMLSPYITKRIIDDVIVGQQMGLLKGFLLGLAGITLARVFLGYAKEYLFDISASSVIVDLRKDLFDHIQKLSFSFFDGSNTGELMSRIKEDTENILHALAFGIMLTIELGTCFIVAAVLLFTLSWKLALICMITMPLIAVLAIKLEKRIGEIFGKISDQRAILNITAQENISGVRLVKAFSREKYEIEKFLKQNKESYKLSVEQASIWATFFPKIEFLANVVVVLVISVGGYFVIGKEVSIGTLVAFGDYVFALIWPMRLIGWLTNILAQCYTSINKIENVFNEEPMIKNPEKAVKPSEIKGHIVFKDVCLEYNGTPVLKNINIDAKPGSTVAIMGLTGAGKSSVINLIGRYYDCTSGGIYIDGINVKDMDLNTLREQISMVMQDTFLFSDTIEENIKLGAENATDKELLETSRDAKTNDFINRMPKKYKTVIGERGIGLSGGQKQRISIARALIRKCAILILDDATSAVDMETEHEIQQALEKQSSKTKFIIAHRVSAVKNADTILIMEQGEIVERGKHDELIKLEGRYYETYCQQFRGLLAVADEEVV